MQYVFAALTGVFAIGYAAVRQTGGLLSRLFFKCAASVMFVMIAYSAGAGSSKAYHVLILLGLCLSLVGDVLLIFTQKKYLISGAVFFLAAHLCYIAAFWVLAPPGPADFAIFAVLVTIGTAAFRKKLCHPGRLVIGGAAYAAVLCAMTAKALGLLFVCRSDYIYVIFAAVGTLLFALSDMALAYGWFYPAKKHGFGIFSTFSYYTGQILIALSVMI